MHTPVSACDPRPALSHPGASSRPRYPQNRSKEAQDRWLPSLRRARLALGGAPAALDALFRRLLAALAACHLR